MPKSANKYTTKNKFTSKNGKSSLLNSFFKVSCSSLLLLLLASSTVWAKGKILLIGGGERPAVILQKMIELSDGKILIIPHASSIPDEVATSAKRQLEEAGAKNVEVSHCNKKNVQRSCLEQIRKTGLIYFTGGSQSMLMNAFKDSEALALIRQRHELDLHLAGTSAGTAVMSEVMITGNPVAPAKAFDSIAHDLVETSQGFGFITKLILDQHFIKRSRHNRLMSLVLDQPSLIGVGVDEATAILIAPDESFEILGKGAVVVYDARKAQTNSSTGLHSAQNLRVHLLTHGQKFSIAE